MPAPNENGMTTAEYAVGTVAATAFGGSLLLLAPVYFGLLRHLLSSIVESSLHTMVPPW